MSIDVDGFAVCFEMGKKCYRMSALYIPSLSSAPSILSFFLSFFLSFHSRFLSVEIVRLIWLSASRRLNRVFRHLIATPSTKIPPASAPLSPPPSNPKKLNPLREIRFERFHFISERERIFPFVERNRNSQTGVSEKFKTMSDQMQGRGT